MILLAEKITKSFSSSGERFYVFQDLSINIESKELVTIVGPSGSGKSTLLNILGTLILAKWTVIRWLRLVMSS